MREIPLTQGKVALVDDADYEWLMQWKWYAHRNPNKIGDRWVAIRGEYSKTYLNGNNRIVYMHRVICERHGISASHIDHREHNGLDNRLEKIRGATSSLNQANKRLASNNKSGFKGVSWNAARKRWMARLGMRSGPKVIGQFINRTDAAKAYDDAAVEKWGEFALTNKSMGLL